ALHPQLASPRPLAHGHAADFKAFFQHYAWAQSQGVKWFAVCLDDTSWGKDGPMACGSSQSALVNEIFERLQAKDNQAKMIFCPASFWGDGTNPEHAAYLNSCAGVEPGCVCVLERRRHRHAAHHARRRAKLQDGHPAPAVFVGQLSGERRQPDHASWS